MRPAQMFSNLLYPVWLRCRLPQSIKVSCVTAVKEQQAEKMH